MKKLMRHTYLFGFLAVVGCSSNHEHIIKDVCVPINEEGGPQLEDLAKSKGYDIEKTKDICRKYFKERLKKLNDDVRASGM